MTDTGQGESVTSVTSGAYTLLQAGHGAKPLLQTQHALYVQKHLPLQSTLYHLLHSLVKSMLTDFHSKPLWLECAFLDILYMNPCWVLKMV